MEAFRQGKLAEPLVHECCSLSFKNPSKEKLNKTQAFNVGLVKSHYDSILAILPDAIAILHIATEVPNGVSRDSHIAKDCYKLVAYHGKLLDAGETVELSYEDNILVWGNGVMENKHKLEAGTIQESWNIVGDVLNGGRIKVIHVGTLAGDLL